MRLVGHIALLLIVLPTLSYAEKVEINSFNQHLLIQSSTSKFFCLFDQTGEFVVGQRKVKRKSSLTLFVPRSRSTLKARLKNCKARTPGQCKKRKKALKDFRKAERITCPSLSPFGTPTPSPSTSPTATSTPNQTSSPTPTITQSPTPSPTTPNNNRPVADAGEDFTIPTSGLVTLNGSGSFDIDNDSLNFEWNLVHKPFHSAATLAAPSSMSPSFTPDIVGTYHFELVVSDGSLSSEADTVVVTLGDVLKVGPGRAYTIPSQAIAASTDGDTIEIDAGEYLGDVSNIYPNNLTIRGVRGRAHLRADGHNIGGKGIWVVKGNNTTIESIEFSEASVHDENGAGIRQEGENLTVTNCNFHDNENGILAGNSANSVITISHSEFANNGFGDGQSHNLYINKVAALYFFCNYSHNAMVGHNLKSRAHNNFVLYNRIMDEETGSSSYLIDLPNGGTSFVIGNLLQQGVHAENSSMVSYAAEGFDSRPTYERNLYVVNNTFVNDRNSGHFVRVHNSPPLINLTNNLFMRNGNMLTGTTGSLSNNLSNPSPGLSSTPTFNYSLLAGSPAIDAGATPPVAQGINTMPTHQYLHPAGCSLRPISGILDIGALESTP